MCRLRQVPFDRLRMDVIAVLHRIPDRQLSIMVIGQREGHHAFQGDLIGAKLLNNLRGDACQFKAAAHQIGANPELERDLFLRTAL